LTIAPLNSTESGANATLGKFVSGYKGLLLSSSTLQYPGKPVYSNGTVCPKGTPDAGKEGVVIVDSWANFEAKGAGTETSGAPQDLLLGNGQLITMAFVPATATVPKPPATVITNLLTSLSQGTTTTTTAPLTSTSTTTPGTTSTTTPGATPGTTSTTTPGTTSTTTGSVTSTTVKS
jgi:hypothetical protein